MEEGKQGFEAWAVQTENILWLASQDQTEDNIKEMALHSLRAQEKHPKVSIGF